MIPLSAISSCSFVINVLNLKNITGTFLSRWLALSLVILLVLCSFSHLCYACVALLRHSAEESNSTEISVKFTVSMDRHSILLFKAPYVTSVLVMQSCYVTLDSCAPWLRQRRPALTYETVETTNSSHASFLLSTN